MRKLSTSLFIEKAQLIHFNKFDYSQVNYINNCTKVSIICPTHGLFYQTPNNHLSGADCIKCTQSNPSNKSNTSIFINKAMCIHGDTYNYTLVTYDTNKRPIKIICKLHGEFIQIPSHHLNGSGCPKCANDVKSLNYFLDKSKLIHGDRFDYSLVDYINTNIKVKIICPLHGEFLQKPSHHYNGAGCQKCNESKGERNIRKYLEENNILFEKQKRFKECRDKKPLPFDFYLPDYQTCIEFDGKQHYTPVEMFGGRLAFLDRVRKDKIKTEFCKNKSIKLIRITTNNDINLIKEKINYM